MEILVFLFAMELGYMPVDMFKAYERDDLAGGYNYYVSMNAEIDALDGMLFIGGTIRTNFTEKSFDSYSPYGVAYTFFAGIRPVEGLEIGFRHMCMHPIATYMAEMNGEIKYEGGYEEIYIKISGRIPLIGGK